MDSFEDIVAAILERRGYWVRRCFKVELTKAEKKEIRRPSSPRWEIDLVAYYARSNEVLAVECKSYFDSVGVSANSFEEQDLGSKSNLKLFVEPYLREVVLQRLGMQMLELGLCASQPKIRLALATGHISREPDRERIKALFAKEHWELFDEKWLRSELQSMANSGYEDMVPSVVAKLLLRGPV